VPVRFTLRQLEYFAAVGEAGSIAEAARRVHVSSPSISAAVAQLEAELGVPLFVRRHAHALALTHAGRLLLAQAQDTIAAAEGLAAIASDMGSAVSGPLSVGCLTTFAALILPELRRSFEATHPAVAITQYELDHADLMDRLLAGRIDLALSYDLSIPPGVSFEPLASLNPWVMLPAAHPFATRPALGAADIAPEAMVLLDLPYSNAYFLSLFERAGLQPRIVDRTRDMYVLRAMVANGRGYSLVNIRTSVDVAPDGKRLAFVPLSSGLRPLRLGLAAPEGGFRRAAAAAFRDHCRAEIARQGLPGCLPQP
jgi:DNA-binding transcriptional LysR family regulator